MEMTKQDIERFWAKVDVRGPDDCWLWLGAGNSDGYGTAWFGNRRQGAHRVSLVLKLGREILPGWRSLHTCDNPPCCNPAHLYEGTRLDNEQDALERGRKACGERNASAKLNEEQVIYAMARMLVGESKVSISREYGVDPSTISDIWTGKAWAHLFQEHATG